MSRLAIGTAQFGLQYGIANKSGRISPQESKSILNLARESSVDLIDTAMSYGKCESILGEIGVDGFRVITKIALESYISDSVEHAVFEKVKSSLHKMRVNSIYALLLHQPSQLLSTQGDAIYRALLLLKDLGLIQKIGISIYSPNELESILAKYRIDIVQVPFSIFDQRIYFSGWLDKLKRSGIEVHVRSIFLQGLLLLPKNKVPVNFSKWSAKLELWRQWLEHNHLSGVQACLLFALSFEQIDRVIVGVDGVEQFSQALEFSKKQSSIYFPDFHIDDENLINPMNWNRV